MARKKKHHQRKTHHRRRIGAVAGHGIGNDLVEAAGIAVGATVATIAQRHLGSLNPKIVSAGELISGIMLKHRAKGAFMQGISYGLIGAGAIGIVHEVGLIRGLDDMVSGLYQGGPESYLDMPHTSGLSNGVYTGGMSNQSRVSGDVNIPPVGF